MIDRHEDAAQASEQSAVTWAASLRRRASLASLSYPKGIDVDDEGNLFIADHLNRRIRKVDTSGIISTIAGTGEYGYAGDGGPATAAKISGASDVVVDHATGDVYFTDPSSSVVRKIDAAGIITTVAGTGVWGFSGDGGPATAAAMRGAQGLLLDGSGGFYVTTRSDGRVRHVDANGTIDTVAGGGDISYPAAWAADDYQGPSMGAPLVDLDALAFDQEGNLVLSTKVVRRIPG